MRIEKKTWPEEFVKIKSADKRVDIRLADFKLNIGDVIVFKEYDPKTKQYTGNEVSKEVIKLDKMDLTKWWSKEEIVSKGIYLIGLSKK